eukprot:780401-Prorocentrum_lima.AAC.1
MFEYPAWKCKVDFPMWRVLWMWYIGSHNLPDDPLTLPHEIDDDDDEEGPHRGPRFKTAPVRCQEILGSNRDELLALCANAGRPMEDDDAV